MRRSGKWSRPALAAYTGGFNAKPPLVKSPDAFGGQGGRIEDDVHEPDGAAGSPPSAFMSRVRAGDGYGCRKSAVGLAFEGMGRAIPLPAMGQTPCTAVFAADRARKNGRPPGRRDIAQDRNSAKAFVKIQALNG